MRDEKQLLLEENDISIISLTTPAVLLSISWILSKNHALRGALSLTLAVQHNAALFSVRLKLHVSRREKNVFLAPHINKITNRAFAWFDAARHTKAMLESKAAARVER